MSLRTRSGEFYGTINFGAVSLLRADAFRLVQRRLQFCDLYLWNLAARRQPSDDNFLDTTEACLRSLGVYLGN